MLNLHLNFLLKEEMDIFLGFNIILIKVKLVRDRAVLKKMPHSLFMPLPIFWIWFNWPLACRRVNEVLFLLLYLSLLSWFLALDKGCSAMNSSLKATVLEYIYKWTEKGWNTQQVSELYSSPMRQTQDKLCKYWTSVPTRVGNVHGTHTWLTFELCWLCHQKNLFFTCNTTCLFCRRIKLTINADSSFDMTFLATFSKKWSSW